MVLAAQLVVKQSQNKGVEERNRRDQEALQSRSDPTVSLRDKTGQVGWLRSILMRLSPVGPFCAGPDGAS
jgi:hypothetical protein